ncbi:MAG TPA: DUF4132 domain-containing protein [Povalibacter sp.]|uniref:DUF4132 domain-containing protein n=1 Tax=Povalibacter sp. TaxID=1962978 RepID=UPI002BF780A7|nr:DUF4132 domain-containing protein [Povalibacter sp.]HMN46913.1 DUF4132 domain-containing protein [Povalibacter sp.]
MPASAWPAEAIVSALHRRDGTPLPAADVAALLHLLRNGLPESARPTALDMQPVQPWRRSALPQSVRTVLDAFRERCGEQALDTWMAALVRSWLHDIGTGTARKMRWVVPGAAVLGGDACAALIGPHLRSDNYHLRCTGEVGVSALLEIGTRTALLELARLGRKLPGKLRGEAALRTLQTIAARDGLTPEQLEDRILADGGLDADGRRSFDYGPRQFELTLDEHLTPLLRAADGRRLTSLPKPTAKDDSVRAAQARAEWRVAKAQITQTSRWLAARFERAMISGETWPVGEFDAYFRRHPLARHAVRRVLWMSTGSDAGNVCFRVAEDDTLADMHDAPIELPGGMHGIHPVHPLDLASDRLDAWRRLLAEYRIVSPFQQLDRPVFRPQPAQLAQCSVTSFAHERFEVKALVFPLENRGWLRERHPDDGMLKRHTRAFARWNVTACIEYTPGAFLGDLLNSGIQTLRSLYFVASDTHAHMSRALLLGNVPPIVFSETLRDLHALLPAD